MLERPNVPKVVNMLLYKLNRVETGPASGCIEADSLFFFAIGSL